MSYKVSLVNLGCSKNRVDAEIMLALLKDAGYDIVLDASVCDIVIVNTCGFIKESKQESIEEILNVIRLKNAGYIKHIIVTGCLGERYKEEVMKEFPEIDAVIGIGANSDIVNVVEKALKGNKTSLFPDKIYLPLNGQRFKTTPKHYAYLKVADGCDNCCTYCAIPIIRGRFRSRKMEDIIEEAKSLAKKGVKELLVIAQDTTRYGEDLYGKLMLPALLKELCKINDIKWIRILYCYPDRVTDELIETIKSEEKILNYIDIPLQHCNGRILKNMNRRGDKESLTSLLTNIREKLPNVTLRTTFICGFPGETDQEFEELLDFVKDIKFERMGCFPYSREEDTKAYDMSEQIADDVKLERQRILMQEQDLVMNEYTQKMLNKIITVLVEGYDEEEDLYYGRGEADSPDVDTRVYLKTDEPLEEGSFRKAKITGCIDYDLVGEILN